MQWLNAINERNCSVVFEQPNAMPLSDGPINLLGQQPNWKLKSVKPNQ
jgi:hypothetical protein